MAVAGAGFAVLFEFDDVAADLPIGFGDDAIDRLVGAFLAIAVALGDAPEKGVVAGVRIDCG